MTKWWTLIVVVGLALSGARAHAQETSSSEARDEEARVRFEAGRLAYADSRYADALEDFEGSYALSGRPELLYNMGQCLDRLRRDTEAIDVFSRYLSALPGASNHVEVETRLEVLRTAVRERETVAIAPEVLTAAPAPSGGGIETEWWFWTALGGGAVVIGAIVAAVVVSTSGTSTEPLYPGNVGPGGIVVALEAP